MFKKSGSHRIDFIRIYEDIEGFWEDLPFNKKRRRKKRILSFLKFFSLFLLAVLIFFLIVFAIVFSDFKAVYSNSMEAKELTLGAVGKMKQRDFTEARETAERAQKKFEQVDRQVTELNQNFLVSNSPFLKSQVKDIDHLIESAFLLTKTLKKGAAFGSRFEKYLSRQNDLRFSKFTEEERKEILQLIYEHRPELEGIKANIDLALLELERVDFNPSLWGMQSRINEVKEKIKKGRKLVDSLTDVFYLSPELAGYPDESNFLVVFQNSNELRATGGFLGTYGILRMKNGEIKEFNTHDIYHMDMPVRNKLKTTPPEPIKKYLNDTWYLRDANWSPDWPTSAKKISELYHKENKLLSREKRADNFNGEFDGVIAVTPDLVTDILTITGPITVKDNTYNDENFLELLQYEVQQGFRGDTSSWERKEVIGDILKKMKIKFFDLPFSSCRQAARLVNENVLEKNIMVYLEEDYYENLIEKLGASGKVRRTNFDYAMLVDSNMGALKTDSVIKRNISYEVEKSLGGLFVDYKITYSHGGGPDWKVSEYKSYTRLLAPAGSKIVYLKGDNVSFPDGNRVEVDEVAGKTSFGSYFTLEPEQIGTLHFRYKLPARIEDRIDSGQYNLYLQKQPGSEIENLTVDISLSDKIKSYNPLSFFAEVKKGGNRVIWKTDFEKDKVFEIDLSK